MTSLITRPCGGIVVTPARGLAARISVKDFVCLCGLLLRLLLRIDAGVIAGAGVSVGTAAGTSAGSGAGEA